MFTIDHLGIAVKSLASAKAIYQKLGMTVSAEELVEAEQVRVVMVPVGEARLELAGADFGELRDRKIHRQARRRLAPCVAPRSRLDRSRRSSEKRRRPPGFGRHQDRRRRASLRVRASLQHWRRAFGIGRGTLGADTHAPSRHRHIRKRRQHRTREL